MVNTHDTVPEPGGAIVVFSPTPVLTVTIETRPDDVPDLHVHPGGQGFWVARMIARLGVDVTLCAPLGGDTGRLLKTLIPDERIRLVGTDIAGANGSYVHDRRTGERVEICCVPGSKLTRHEYDDLYNATFTAAMNAGLLVLTGQYPSPVVPANVFQRLAHDLRANGKTVLADLSGDDLTEALQGGVDVLCFSHEELLREKLARSHETPELIAGLETLCRRGAQHIVLHRAAEPGIIRLGDRLYEVVSPKVNPLDHRGGGDTFFAALAVGLVRQQSMQDTIRFATAAGTLNVTRHGLGTGRVEDIASLSRHVQIRPLTS
jgi:1-phosphofructokinase